MHYDERHSQEARLTATNTRTRMVRSAASLIRSRGVSATSFSDVIADSGAPRGSIYHHFPEGKEQLAAEAIRWTSQSVEAYLRTRPAFTPEEVLERFIDIWRQVVVASHGAAGCVVAGVAIDTVAGDEGLIKVVRATFRYWVAMLAEQLEAIGVPSVRARPIATATVAGMEGALILCRSEGDSGPLETVAAELVRLLPLDA
jgi:AcrR family transcriptional regulator